MESFNEDFCIKLEYHLSETFENSNRKDIRGFWCDGVSWVPTIEGQLSKKNVNDSRKIITKAWIGKEGQDEFELTLIFGKYSLRRYANGESLDDRIPSVNTMDWVNIDLEKRTIELKLN